MKEYKSFFERKQQPYYVVAPDYRHSSGGVRACHYLCHALNELGFEAYVTASPESCSPYLRTPSLTREIQERHRTIGLMPIAVYPEVVHGNPLGLPVVARWLLNRPGLVGGDIAYSDKEILFYWEKYYLPTGMIADKLLLPIIDRRIFNDKAPIRERHGFCYYANKYFSLGINLPEALTQYGTNLCLSIARSPQEIAEILRTSKVLYCYEPSSITSEALACGCQVVYVDTPYLKIANLPETSTPIRISESLIGKMDFIPEVDKVAVDHFFAEMDQGAWLQLENFTQKTQAAAANQLEYQRTPDWKLQTAVAAFHAGNHEGAMSGLAPLLEEQPNNPLPPAYLSFICATQGLAQEAQQFMEKAMELAPGRADFQAALGESFLKTGEIELALGYLQEAIHLQPDMLSAYPALARSLHLTHQSDVAISLLKSTANMPSNAQANIQTTLLEILAEQGNIAEFSLACLRYSKGIADDLLAVRCLARFDASGERLVEALGAAQARLAHLLSDENQAAPLPIGGNPPWKIVFLSSDFAREEQQGRLWALLNHLPPEQFNTTLIINDPLAGPRHLAQASTLIVDHTLVIHDLDDAKALDLINTVSPDIFIDMDSYGPNDRLSLFVQVRAGIKLLWGEAPMPALAPNCFPLQGEAVADQDMLPGVILPGLGEYCELPDLPIKPASITLTLGCLTPAIRIGPEGWHLFAEVLRANPESQLLLNLKDLGDCAQDYITRQFEQAGVAATRLQFVHAHTPEELCHYWQEVHLGLAPPVDAGDQALTTCLWMGRPFVALAASLPWSHRPAALLHCAGASAWIADSASRYVELASRLPKAPDPSLRARLRAAGLDDPAAFARGFAATMADLMQTAPAPSPAP